MEPQILGAQLILALAQRGGSLLDQALETAIELIELADHQRDRSVGPPAVMIGLLVGAGDQCAERIEIDLAGGLSRLGKLSGKKLVHVIYPTASDMVVTVMV